MRNANDQRCCWKLLILFLFMAVLLGVVVSVAEAHPIHFVTVAGAGSGNGSSWANAHAGVQAALAAAVGGDEIWVAKGTYRPTGGPDPTATFRLLDNVALYGGFDATETAREDRDWSNHVTILSGDIGTPDDNTDNSYHVVTGSGTNTTAVLDGFTVRDGNAPVSTTPWVNSGAGMYNDGGSPTVANCTFSYNHALAGAGMYNDGGSPTVTNCTFSENVGGYGGGMANSGGSNPTVTDCSFSENQAFFIAGGMANGGGSNPTVFRCTFSGNSAPDGGGMENFYSAPTVTNCTFSDNEANCGGGMRNVGSSPTVTNCTFSGNSVDGVSSAGGGMYNLESSPTVDQCTFSENSSEYYGGGMYNLESSPTVENCTFSGNEAGDGGGMYNQNSDPTVTNCTFSANMAGSGGGIHNNSASPTVMNTILAGNIPDDCYVCAKSTFNSSGYNLEGGTSCGCTALTDQQNTNPMLGPLADNGGPSETHALLPGSPAIDTIPWPYNDAPSTDQRGFPRPYGLGGFADIGAVEMQLAYSLGDVNGDGAIDLLDVVLCARIAAGLNVSLAQRLAADMDRDGDVDMDDVSILSAHILATGGGAP
ncbi:right-handed parallel beta-helix repeat-containing protein [Candidatus Bipolaricaulota bacterium]